ncbi:MAG: hybrid sensor histidine kinase/response regulator [Bacteroidia bacterium]|nr:hybrid sensor histidine kinase/response regulator [Bacteroidia bacterium]
MQMNKENESFYRELLDDFVIESAEHFDSIVQGVHDLVPGNSDSNPTLLETLFRNTHSLKGAARAMNFKQIEKACSALENIFGKIRSNEIPLTNTLIKEIQNYTKLIKELVGNVTSKENPVSDSRIVREIRNLENTALNPATTGTEQVTQQKKSKTDKETEPLETPNTQNSGSDSAYVRIPTEHLAMILQQSENFIAIKNTLGHYKKEIDEIYRKYPEINIYELLRDISSFENIVSRMTVELTNSIRETLLSRFGNFFRLLERMVKEIAEEHGKEVDFKTEGSGIEIDRRILEELKDPMIHIMRNCIDHGIEESASRLSKGKPAKGTITLKVEKLTNRNLVIVIEDDGSGIDREKVKNSAIKNGLLTEQEAKELSGHQIDDLIFASGVTSKKFVTDISGRGLGMSIVADKIARLDGVILTESEKNSGTRFTITLPQTIATFKGILVKCGKQQLMIPSKFVTGAKRVKKSDIASLGNGYAIRVGKGPSIGIVKLCDIMSIPQANQYGKTEQSLNILFISRKESTFAYIVDEIFQEYEGIIQGTGQQLQYTKNIEGVTLIKNGVVVPVVNVKELLQNTKNAPTSIKGNVASGQESQTSGKVLIAEDSITIRSMLRNIVENAGYEVITAVDGRDAYNKVKSEQFDVVVSDIEMPNMNGFELTRNIKENPATEEIPVILVTALESQSDMKKGMDAGADAYIVKSSFEKSNLVETIKRFI